VSDGAAFAVVTARRGTVSDTLQACLHAADGERRNEVMA
jgi:hypothetical protein